MAGYLPPVSGLAASTTAKSVDTDFVLRDGRSTFRQRTDCPQSAVRSTRRPTLRCTSGALGRGAR